MSGRVVRASLRMFRVEKGALVVLLLASLLISPGCNTCVTRSVMTTSTITTPANRPGAELTDLYVFPSPTNPANVVLAMGLHPAIPSGMGPATFFDHNVVFQFKVDNTGDLVEDLVIRVAFSDVHSSGTQFVTVAGPSKPRKTGTLAVVDDRDNDPVSGELNTPFTLSNGVRVFAGAREDPFFFDLNAFYSQLPDRAALLGPTFVDINGVAKSTSPRNPDQLQLTSFRGPGAAEDFFRGLNLLAIVVEVPRSALGGKKINVWATASDRTSPKSCTGIAQVSRQGRPLATTVFPTVAGGRQEANNGDNPKDDLRSLASDVQAFMTVAAGRSQAVTAAVQKVFVPDVLTADLSAPGPASYLALELAGLTGPRPGPKGAAVGPNGVTFGGRALTDDVVDAMFGIVFGSTLPRLSLAPDDGREIPGLTSDNVGDGDKHFQAVFPYLGPPL